MVEHSVYIQQDHSFKVLATMPIPKTEERTRCRSDQGPAGEFGHLVAKAEIGKVFSFAALAAAI